MTSLFSGLETIIVVDDDPGMRRLATLMLERFGYRVLTAASGHEALHLLATWPELDLDLMLIDILMPGMNGIELAEQMRAIRPGLHILFCSAYSEQELLRPVIARGVPYIAKPFTSLQLMKKIRQMLDRPQAESATAE